MDKGKKIIWGEIADKQFKKALAFYFQKDAEVEASIYLKTEVNHVLELVSVNNFIGKPIEKTKFRTIIVLQFSIIYQVNEENITVILFWNTHRDPKILKILLQELQ